MRLDVKSKRGDSVEPGDQPSLKMFAKNSIDQFKIVCVHHQLDWLLVMTDNYLVQLLLTHTVNI